jgi:D-serine deaminase-like pyridoxal phosphate-dependent protein
MDLKQPTLLDVIESDPGHCCSTLQLLPDYLLSNGKNLN